MAADTRVRESIYIYSGAAGLGIAYATARELRNALPSNHARNEEPETIFWPSQETSTKPITLLGFDTDSVSESKYVQAIRRELAGLGLAFKYHSVEGGPAGQEPRTVHERLEGQAERLRKVVAQDLASVGIDARTPAAVFLTNSLHGSGAAINLYLVEKIIPEVVPSAALKADIAILTDITKLPSILNYRESIRWSLNTMKRLLQNNALDFVLTVENTFAAALATVFKGGADLGSLRDAYRPFIDALKSYSLHSDNAYDNYVAAIRKLMMSLASLAKEDPATANETIVQAVSPISTLVSLGLELGREVLSASAPQDFVNMRKLLASGSAVPYVSVAYLPSDYILRSLKPASITHLIRALGLSWLAPFNLVKTQRLVFVLGEGLRRRFGIGGVSFDYEVENAVKNEFKFNGHIDVLTVTNCSSAWLYAVQTSDEIFRSIYELEDSEADEM